MRSCCLALSVFDTTLALCHRVSYLLPLGILERYMNSGFCGKSASVSTRQGSRKSHNINLRGGVFQLYYILEGFKILMQGWSGDLREQPRWVQQRHSDIKLPWSILGYAASGEAWRGRGGPVVWALWKGWQWSRWAGHSWSVPWKVGKWVLGAGHGGPPPQFTMEKEMLAL